MTAAGVEVELRGVGMEVLVLVEAVAEAVEGELRARATTQAPVRAPAPISSPTSMPCRGRSTPCAVATRARPLGAELS